LSYRVGQGFDVHPFDQDRPLLLGGVRLAENGGLAGHSDADAVLHAITDALLGAVGAGDIGEYFPSNDDRWKDADSIVFLGEACEQVRRMGGAIVNVDVTIIAERPRLAPHRAAMKARIAQLLSLQETAVNVKATTTDGLGFTGRGEGVAALAVALVMIDEGKITVSGR